ncbi:GIY-YIG nuclease family protein [Streptomyces rochei]|uniref:GIY-YIG nuclease family protein n=1 Tax=Streptomyces rochei TaxID=1928 RepID=UPI0036C9A442
MNDPWHDDRRFYATLEGAPLSVAATMEERFPPLSPERQATFLRGIFPNGEVPRQDKPGKRRRPTTPTTYLIGIEGSHLVKIGYTGGDPRARLAALQTGQPMKLSLLWACPGNFEADLHLHFDAYHYRGEWFDLSPLGDPVVAVETAVAAFEVEADR